MFQIKSPLNKTLLNVGQADNPNKKRPEIMGQHKYLCVSNILISSASNNMINATS